MSEFSIGRRLRYEESEWEYNEEIACEELEVIEIGEETHKKSQSEELDD